MSTVNRVVLPAAVACVTALLVGMAQGSTLAGEAPLAPSNLVAVSSEDDFAVELSWQDNSDNETGFSIESSEGGPGFYVEFTTVPADTTSYVFPHDPMTSYGVEFYYRVRAYNGAGYSDYSNEAHATVLPSIPEAPSNLRCTYVFMEPDMPVVFYVSWDDNSDNEDGFGLERTEAGQAAWNDGFPGSLYGADTTDGYVEGEWGVAYEIRAHAFLADPGLSLWSDFSNIIVVAAMGVPSMVMVEATGPYSLNVSWAGDCVGETGFSVERRVLGGEFAEVATVPGDTNQYLDEGLQPDTTYQYRVRAFNDWGVYNDYSEVAAGTTAGLLPAAPAHLMVFCDGMDAIQVLWTDQSVNEDGFRVERRSLPDGTFETAATVAENTMTYRGEGLAPGSDYEYRVAAFNSTGDSDYTSAAATGTRSDTLVQVYVDVSNTSGVEDGSAEHPWNTIQEAIDNSGNGTEVIVAPGTYFENLDFTESVITQDFLLRSTDPLDEGIVAATVVDGGDTTHAIDLHVSQDDTCEVSGFTVTNGYAPIAMEDPTDDLGGGIRGYGSHCKISHCVINGNCAEAVGGGIARCAGVITECSISNNSAKMSGGGLLECDGLISGCAVSDNTTLYAANGGGLQDCHGYVVGCLITNNGGAVMEGGGLSNCDGTIANCTITDNLAGDYGGGLCHCSGKIVNCIIWGNSAGMPPHYAGYGRGAYQVWPVGSDVTYCCIEEWKWGGIGNVNGDPLFVAGPRGDYYLSQVLAGQSAQSPCVDAGSGRSCARRTTRTDQLEDCGAMDMGYHYPADPPVASVDAGWLLFSVPYEAADWSVGGVLHDAEAAGNVLEESLFRFCAVVGYEAYPWHFSAMESARGYWLRVRFPFSMEVEGTQFAVDQQVPLSIEWNLVGHPFAKSVPLSACRVTDGFVEKALTEAAECGWLDPTLHFYRSGYGYGLLRADGVCDDGCLRPWHGYWLLAYQPGLELIVPAP